MTTDSEHKKKKSRTEMVIQRQDCNHYQPSAQLLNHPSNYMMRFDIPLLLCIFGSTSALPLTPRQQEPPVEAAIRGVGQGFEKLDAHFNANTKSWASKANRIVTDAQTITADIIKQCRLGVSMVSKGPNIVPDEAFKLKDWGEALTQYYERTMQVWMNQKSMVKPTGKAFAIAEQLADLMLWCEKFNDEIMKKMPAPAIFFMYNFKTRQSKAVTAVILEYENLKTRLFRG